jgi:hypothetical protein
MAIKFERDKYGNIIAVDENNKQIGSVSTMGDEVKDGNVYAKAKIKKNKHQ